MSEVDKHQILKTKPEELRRRVQTTELYLDSRSVKMTVDDKIARDLGLRQLLEELDEDEENPTVIQSIGPTLGPDKIELDVVW